MSMYGFYHNTFYKLYFTTGDPLTTTEEMSMLATTGSLLTTEVSLVTTEGQLLTTEGAFMTTTEHKWSTKGYVETTKTPKVIISTSSPTESKLTTVMKMTDKMYSTTDNSKAVGAFDKNVGSRDSQENTSTNNSPSCKLLECNYNVRVIIVCTINQSD